MKRVMSVSVDEGILKDSREAAYENRISFSQWVERAMLDYIGVDSVERVNADLTMPGMPEKDEVPLPEFPSLPDEPEVSRETVFDEAQILAEAQARLDSEKKKRKIKEGKIKKVREVQSLTGHVGEYSKKSQVGGVK